MRNYFAQTAGGVGFCLLALLMAFPVKAATTSVDTHPKKIFAHFMACYPVAAAATGWHRANDPQTTKYDGTGQFDAIGDRWRNWPLVPDNTNLTLEESADLEIRRALRAGIDGFSIDAWAGGEGAKQFFDMLFTVAEKHNYPFEITICLDNENVTAIKYMLEKHGNSPKLARRDGKPLIFGYLSIFPSFGNAANLAKDLPAWQALAARDGENFWKSPELRTTPAGWELLAKGYQQIEKEVGTPLYLHYCIGAFFHQVDGQYVKPGMLTDAAAYLATQFPAIGAFTEAGPESDAIADAVKAKGAEWCQPMIYQYENIGWGGNRNGNGADILRNNWVAARKHDSTLIQFVTWNDYTENTHLAPAYDTRYSILDLNARFINWWKTGKAPTSDHDVVYLIYRKYPKGAKLFPFKPKQPDTGGMLEVLTILPKPATIRLPGRNAEYKAPKGMYYQQFPLTAGPVIAEVVRKTSLFGHQKVAVHLESPEPITERPFREQNGMVCFSTEEQRQWTADFGATPMVIASEYADADNDGLPNWFEMYYFGKFLDWSTATVADPNADPDGDGKTNLREYLAQTDPTKADK